MAKFHKQSMAVPAFFATLVLAATVACSSDIQSATSPFAVAGRDANAVAATTQTFTLSSVTPPIQCTDASGAVTTVTGGTLVLSSTGKFEATFATQTDTNGVITTGTVTQKGSFTQSGSTITFKVPGTGTFTGALVDGTLTITGLPLCGSTHTAVFTQV
jgi:hypothetical protein